MQFTNFTLIIVTDRWACTRHSLCNPWNVKYSFNSIILCTWTLETNLEPRVFCLIRILMLWDHPCRQPLLALIRKLLVIYSMFQCNRTAVCITQQQRITTHTDPLGYRWAIHVRYARFSRWFMDLNMQAFRVIPTTIVMCIRIPREYAHSWSYIRVLPWYLCTWRNTERWLLALNFTTLSTFTWQIGEETNRLGTSRHDHCPLKSGLVLLSQQPDYMVWWPPLLITSFYIASLYPRALDSTSRVP